MKLPLEALFVCQCFFPEIAILHTLKIHLIGPRTKDRHDRTALYSVAVRVYRKITSPSIYLSLGRRAFS